MDTIDIIDITLIYLTRTPVLMFFKPIQRIELLCSGVFDRLDNKEYILRPTWEGGDLYQMDDLNWAKYDNCITPFNISIAYFKKIETKTINKYNSIIITICQKHPQNYNNKPLVLC